MPLRKNLILFNLELDLDSPVLASNHDLVKELSKHYSNITVCSTHVGRTNLPNHVRIIELGGGNPFRKVVALLRILKIGLTLTTQKNKVEMYHHMSTRTLLILGPFCKLLGIPTLLWYSHSVADRYLKLGYRFADVCLSSTKETFPLDVSNVQAIGHGIALERFDSISNLASVKRNNILALGRLVPIKGLEKIIDTLGAMDSDLKSNFGKLLFIGPSQTNPQYRDMLKERAISKKVNLEITEAMSYTEIPKLLRHINITYSGTPQSVDKAVLEAAISGCFIVSESLTVQNLTGMDLVWENAQTKSDIGLQLKFLQGLDSKSLRKFRIEIMYAARSRNNLSNQVQAIIGEFQQIKESRARV